MSSEPYTTYQLVIRVSRDVSVQVGKLGFFSLPKGDYVYTGSARRHFEARVARHLRSEKKLRWHIDYLLAEPGVVIVEVRRSRTAECTLNQTVQGTIPVSGFGSSDCSSGCGSHLIRLNEPAAD